MSAPSQSHVQPPVRSHSALLYPCQRLGCRCYFKMLGGRTRHINATHPILSPPPMQQHPPLQDSPKPSSRSQSLPPVNTNPATNNGNAADGDPPHGEGQAGQNGWDREEFNPPNYHSPTPSDDHGPQEPPANPNVRFFGPAWPCNEHGEFLTPRTPPLVNVNNPDDWSPYQDQLQFETAKFLFAQCQMSAPKMDAKLPFADHRHIYKTIDATAIGDVKWQSFSVSYTGKIPTVNPPPLMLEKYLVWFRDPWQVVHKVLGNPSFMNEMDLSPFEEYLTEDQIRHYKDFMSGEWAWQQADVISKDERTDGSTFTTVSVATGNNEYYPLYLSIGNVRNNVRRAHRDALVLIGFLAIRKTTKEHASDAAFCKFRRQLFHSSLSAILQPLKPAMTMPEVVKFGDGHFRRVIYGLGPYITDYKEQALLACIVRGWCARYIDLDASIDIHYEDALDRTRAFNEVLFEESTLTIVWEEYGIVGNLVPFTNDFPRANIHQLIAPDILHQLIKGCFKDHLVDWVTAYIHANHLKREADRILDDIDCRIAAQWLSDDSKALMKVYIATIEGSVPTGIIRTFHAFLEFCSLVRRHVITEKTLKEIEDALSRFHTYLEAFRTKNDPIVTTFSLPHQHSAKHYPSLIHLFGAPNGLCSSITECKHIKAVKEPWHQSRKYWALGQMLLTNQRLDKLAASRIDFTSWGMMNETSRALPSLGDNNDGADPTNDDIQLTASMQADNDMSIADNSPTDLSVHVKLARTAQRQRPHTVSILAEELCIPNLSDLLRCFLFDQINPNHPSDHSEVPLAACPHYDGRISTFNSASSRFYAPSDLSGIGGMHTKFICSTPLWRNEDPEALGMCALDIAHVLSFFSFTYREGTYMCAVIQWFNKISDSPDGDTGMWMVCPSYLPNHTPNFAIIHIDTIYRAAHLIPIYGANAISHDIKPHHSYDAFQAFYINKYADHHVFEIAS
ncbi:hypothetical protein BS17DRAFT_863841 [Gyrodon lividus]|nr:hypothetical protein BS17DRAFT_863841 [Gyrodon lividus]